MNKDDKQFFKGLLTDMGQKWDGKFDNLRLELGTEIRHNGVMIERLQDLIQSVAENTTGLNRRLTHVEEVLDI